MGKPHLLYRLLSATFIAALLAGAAPPALADAPAGASPLGGQTAAARLLAADYALAWLAGRQKADGGFGNGAASDWHATVLTVQAFLARGEDSAALVSAGGKTPADYLTANAGAVGSDAYQIAQMILAGIALGQDPTTFAGRNWPAELAAALQPDGHYAGGLADAVTTQSYALIAGRAAYLAAPASAVTWLRAAADADGGFGPTAAGPSDTIHTGLALAALLLAGDSAGAPTSLAAINYLRARRVADGGFAVAAGATSSQLLATAAATRALVIAGEPLLDPAWMSGDWNAFDALLAAQDADGAFRASAAGQPEIGATAAGVAALLAHSGIPRQRQAAVGRALVWLRTQQQANGSFGGGNNTTNAVYAIAKGGQEPAGLAWTPTYTSALQALEALMPTYVGRPDPPTKSNPREAEAAKSALAAVAAGRDPRAFGGYDLLERIQFYYDPATGRYHPTHLFRNDLAIMGLAAGGAPIPPLAIQALLGQQTPCGGWGWASTTTPDMDTTGRTMQALVAGGAPAGDAAFDRAATCIASWQYPDGSLPDRSTATAGNSNSTVLAMAGLLAAGRDPRDAPFVVVSPAGALSSLLDAALSFQEDSGAFIFTRAFAESRILAVLDAIPALNAAFPAYAPPALPAATTAGAARLVAQGDRLVIVAPFSGDGNHNGLLTAQMRVAGGTWVSQPVSKTVGAYLIPLGARPDGRRSFQAALHYQDSDGVLGNADQSLDFGVIHLPMIAK
jgi:hypothetical protein